MTYTQVFNQLQDKLPEGCEIVLRMPLSDMVKFTSDIEQECKDRGMTIVNLEKPKPIESLILYGYNPIKIERSDK